MTLDEAINKLEHGIEQLTMELKSGLWEVGSDTENAIKEGIKDNEQLIAWLIESKEAKRLLKLAMEDMNTLYESGKDEGCYGIKFKWRYTDEALKLIGED